jgi:hypothetical protein
MAIMRARLRRTIGRLAAIGAAALLVAVATASLGANPALAGGKLDQQNPFDGHESGGSGIPMARAVGQTFTAGRTGSLERVALYFERDLGEPTPPGSIFLDIYPTTAAGAPRMNGPAIGSGSIPAASVQADGFFVFPLSQPAPVTKGTRYAIVLHADVALDLAIVWDDNGGPAGPDHYPRGGEAERNDETAPWTIYPTQDYYFKTFVSVSRQRHHHR